MKCLFPLTLVTCLFITLFSAAQKRSQYDIDSIVKVSIPVYDAEGNETSFRIPDNNHYILVYRYRWKSIGAGFDNADSIRLLENKISEVLLGGMVGNLKVICLAYDRKEDYSTWMQNLKKEKPFKSSNKYKVEYYNLNGNDGAEALSRSIFTKLTMLGPDGRIIRHSSAIARFNYHIRDEKVNLRGKVVTVNNGVKEPLGDAMVHVEGNKSDTLGKTFTDKYGDFVIGVPNNDTSYTLKAEPKNKDVKNVMLLTQEGKEISYLRKSFKTFEYKLMKADLLELAEMNEIPDLTLSFKKFEGAKDKELLVVEDITYEPDRFIPGKLSEEILNKVVSIMKQNPAVKLEIISHTDSRGEDAANLSLSEKRAKAVMEYLVKNGVDEKRLKAIGKGETAIRNRCYNGVACSDKEHAYNRRTEFRFIK
jgi:outer membrane protein OmpA-like peptidoglycan-associated protein